MMKNLTITSLLSILLLVACDDSPPSNSNNKAASAINTLAVAQNLPVYTIRFSHVSYPPFNMMRSDGTLMGLESDVLNAIAKQSGFRIQAQPYVWKIIFKDLKKSNAHLVGGGLVEEDFDLTELVLSKPYMRSLDCVVAQQPKYLEDWYKRKIVTVESDELDESLIENHQVKQDNIKNVYTQYQALSMILDKKADVVVSDCHVLKYYIYGSLQNQEFFIKELSIDEGDTSYDLVFGVRKDQTELLNKINIGIEQLKQSGEMDKIIKKWTSKQNHR